MKHFFSMSAILLLALAFCFSGASAQPMDQGTGMQDDPPGQMNMMCGCGGMMNEGMMHGGMMREGGKHGDMMERYQAMQMMMRHLGLNGKQKAEVESIMTAHMKDIIMKQADLKIAELDFKSILSKDPIDMKAAESKLKDIEAMETALFLSHLTVHQDIKSVLTPEQRKKMKEMKEMMEMHMMGKGDARCEMMKGDMKEGEHHGHEKMMK